MLALHVHLACPLLVVLIINFPSSTRALQTSYRPPHKKSLPVAADRHYHHYHGALLEKVRQGDGMLWVDLENVRGKSGFELSHMDVLQQTSRWARHHNLEGRVTVAADHGSLTAAYYVEDLQVGIVFSGNHRKADDVLAQSVDYSRKAASSAADDDDEESKRGGDSVVITADNELQRRCRRAAKHRPLHIWDPVQFLDDLERLMVCSDSLFDPTGVELESSLSTTQPSLEEELQLGKLDDEIRLRAQILEAQIQLDHKRSKTKLTNKKRKTIQSRLDGLKAKLALKGPSFLDQATSLDSVPDGTSMQTREQDLILRRWKQIRSTSARREQTGDRVVLAEEFRRNLLELDSITTTFPAEDDASNLPAKAFVLYFNEKEKLNLVARDARETEGEVKKNLKPVQTTVELLADTAINPLQSLDTIQIVAISDTHGFEGQLISDSEVKADTKATVGNLPKGDLLLHLGDFVKEGSPSAQRESLKNLDEWLARQPHPIKIIVRGNHDPLSYPFEKSGALFITEPTTIDLSSSLKLGVIPFGTPRRWASNRSRLPRECDILATHVPPMKTLDRTCTGKSAGSRFLTQTVHAMGNGAPRLWLCGHIHEGRGVAERKYGGLSAKSTTVINAANANQGRATHLVHSAVVVDFDKSEESQPVKILVMKDKNIAEKIGPHGEFFRSNNGLAENDIQELLVAVDLGLKSGVALYSSDGILLRYEQFHFEKDSLAETVKSLVENWESAANAIAVTHDDEEGTRLPYRVTHIALEGANGYMLQAWSDARPDLSILRVPPEEWRADLLLEKERTSGSNAKAASRLIARQVVDDFGSMSKHEGKFPTDVAEAVCMGFYVGRKLGWMAVDREHAVRRYMNGKVIVPRKM